MSSALVCLSDFEAHAKKVLPQNTLCYYASGANEESTLQNNKDAFKRLRLRPQVLRDVSTVEMSTSVLGEKVDCPICIAPSAMQRTAHHDGELATARAASSAGMCMTLSSLSTTSIEDVAKCSPGLKWCQLYIYNDRDITKDLVLRAERAGYKALVLTVDSPMFGRKYADAWYKFYFPPHLTLSNYKAIKVEMIASLLDSSLTWEAVDWLKSITKLPIVVKGIVTKEDAKLAVKHKVAGILVSNHGGRQLDTVPATIEALPEIVEAVGKECEVYLDGGVRLGTDVFKALAYGAKAVFIGRPVLWGLAYQGEQGVSEVLNILKEELKLTMALMGCRNLGEISQEMVVHESYYSRI